MKKIYSSLALGSVSLALCFSQSALANTYPERPLRLIVPFSAGGPTDTMARLVAESLGNQLGQTIIVQNKPGADNMIAVRELLKSPADGYTVMFTTNGLLSVAPALHKDFPLKPLEQFSYIGGMTTYPYIFVTSKEENRKKIDQFLSDSRKRQDSVSYAVVGNVSAVVGALLTQSLGVKMLPVRYKGNAETVTDIFSQRVNLGMFAPSFSLPLVNDGKLQPLFVTGTKRLPALPEVPLASEVDPALKDFSSKAVVWTALVAPAGLPTDVQSKLQTALEKVVKNPDFEKQVQKMGDQVDWQTGSQTQERVKQETGVWGKVAEESGLSL